MQHSKKFYVIDESGLDRIRRALPPDSETPLKRFNEAFIEGKQLDKNVKDASWKNTGTRVIPIISEGLQKAVQAASTAPTPPVSSVPLVPGVDKDDDDDEIIMDLETALGIKYRNKGMRLYHLIKRLPGVKIRKNGIEVDGYKIRGSSANIISNLVKNSTIIAYESAVLLDKAINEGFGELVLNLISNREAKKYLNTEMAKLESVRTSTPRSDRLPSSSRNLALSGFLENLESDDETFKEARDIIDSAVKTKRGNNKRIKWTSLFAKKNGRKQKGRKYK